MLAAAAVMLMQPANFTKKKMPPAGVTQRARSFIND